MKPHLQVTLLIVFSILTGCKPSIQVRKERFSKECARHVTPYGNFSLFQELKKSFCDCMWEHAVTKLSNEELDSVWSKAGMKKLSEISGACDSSLQERMHSLGFPTKSESDSMAKHNAEILKNSQSIDDYLDSISHK